MKKSFIALMTAAMMGLGASAIANEISGPVTLTDAQMDNVVAGHLLTPGNGKAIPIGGPLERSQGHFRGLDCNAAGASNRFASLGICQK